MPSFNLGTSPVFTALMSIAVMSAQGCGKLKKEDESDSKSLPSVSDTKDLFGVWTQQSATLQANSDQKILLTGLGEIRFRGNGTYFMTAQAQTFAIGDQVVNNNCTSFSSGSFKLVNGSILESDRLSLLVSGTCGSTPTPTLQVGSDAIAQVNSDGTNLQVSLPFSYSDAGGNAKTDKLIFTYKKTDDNYDKFWTQPDNRDSKFMGNYQLKHAYSEIKCAGTADIRGEASISGDYSFEIKSNWIEDKQTSYGAAKCSGTSSYDLELKPLYFKPTQTYASADCLKDITPTGYAEAHRASILSSSGQLATLLAYSAQDNSCADKKTNVVIIRVSQKQ